MPLRQPDWQNIPQPLRYAVVRRPMQAIRISLHPVAAGVIALLMVGLLGWSGATTTYALFRDQFLQQIAARHASSERDSAAEIARLKTELGKVSTRLLVERENFVGQLDALTRRQADLERRQEALSSLSATKAEAPPADDTLRLAPRESRLVPPAEIRARYDRIEQRQKDMTAALQDRLDTERKTLASVYTTLGVRSAEPVKAGLGGLYIPLSFGRTDAVTRSLEHLKESAAETARLRSGLDGLPLRSPYPGAGEASGFGSRVDPFLGTMAFHSGVDLEAPSGAPARATAAGKVVSAGWSGGYGMMVEVEHAHGYSTRYAHLSSITVSEGQEIRIGDVVGRVGSTGRSTGPHLHYETRLNDTALDPEKFLAAGKKLGL